MSRVFVLGAGASKFAGYPLAPDLWKFVRDSDAYFEQLDAERAQQVKEEMRRLLEELRLREPSRPSLEELFTFLDLEQQGVERLPASQIDWRALRPKLIGMISSALMWHQYKLQRALERNDHPGHIVLTKWTNVLHPTDTVISFNWDIMHEAALWRAGKWHYADGYGFPCADFPAGVTSPIKVLKLHGSVNWAQHDESDRIPAIEYKKDFFAGARDAWDTYNRGAGQWSEGRYLVVPSYVKDISANPLLLSLWNQAADSLQAADELIVIGFRLNPADALARHLFAGNLLRNNHCEIRVISPPDYTDLWWDFCHRIGQDRKWEKATFEEWVMSQAG